MPISVRLDPATESKVNRLARQRRQSKSSIVREALEAYESTGRAAAPQTPWEALAPFIGIAGSGGSRRSESTGEGFRAIVAKKARAPRTR
jgi:hypothetical protein